MPTSHFKNSLSSLVWGGFGFTAMLGLVHFATPNYAPKNPKDIMRTKTAFMALPSGQADVVAIGTSHIYRGFDPIAFKKLTGRTSYNLSFNGMSASEMAHMVDFLADNAKAKGVRHVILEGRGFQSINPNNLKTDRVVLASSPNKWSSERPLELEMKSLKDWTPRFFNLAAISKLHRYDFNSQPVDYVQIIDKGEARRRQLKDQGIILPGSSPLKKTVRKAKSDLAHINHKGQGRQDRMIKEEAREEMSEKYDALAAKTLNKTSLKSTEVTHFKAMIENLAEQGVKTHIVLPPTISPEWTRTHDKFVHAKKGALKRTPLYDIRIGKYSENFKNLSLWADHGHLNSDGALVFTGLLAEAFQKPKKPKKKKASRLIAELNTPLTQHSDCEVN